jgi:UPF0716 family protein affecting phage T7 exclusion
MSPSAALGERGNDARQLPRRSRASNALKKASLAVDAAIVAVPGFVLPIGSLLLALIPSGEATAEVTEAGRRFES